VKKPFNSSLFVLLGAAILLFTSCSAEPEKADFYGSYRLIKIKENGQILNIDTLAQVELSEDIYTTAMDRNGDFVLSEDEFASVAYSFHMDREKKPYILINNDRSPVYIWDETHFDLLMKKIDPLGNETVMYFKDLSDD